MNLFASLKFKPGGDMTRKLGELESLKRTCEKFKEEMVKITGENDIRSRCYDIFTDYLEYFESILTILQDIEKEKRRNWGGKASKQILVSLISAIEYSMRKISEMYPRSPLYYRLKMNRDCVNSKTHSLREIVYASADVGIIDRRLKHSFENLIDIRNLLMHNNAICYADGVKIIGDVRIEMKKYNSISINLKNLLGIIKTAIEIFHRWNVSLANSNSKTVFTLRRL
ncbi:hypothetical protein [Archaeoglobus fulgidus]|nr:hypothetical protein [Archaeoglobus fulgidus]